MLLGKLAHLQELLGEERFQALINPNNTSIVRTFCDDLVKSSLPTEMTVGGRTYEILDFLKAGEERVNGNTMIERAEEMDADLGKEDGWHVMEHQNEIPESLRREVIFVFPGWLYPVKPDNVYYLHWNGKWVMNWCWINDKIWGGNQRLLRRKE